MSIPCLFWPLVQKAKMPFPFPFCSSSWGHERLKSYYLSAWVTTFLHGVFNSWHLSWSVIRDSHWESLITDQLRCHELNTVCRKVVALEAGGSLFSNQVLKNGQQRRDLCLYADYNLHKWGNSSLVKKLHWNVKTTVRRSRKSDRRPLNLPGG